MPKVLYALIFLYIALFLSYLKASYSYRAPVLFVLFSGLLMVFYGILISSISNPETDRSHYINHLGNGSTLRIRLIEELKHNDYYFKYLGEIKGVGKHKSGGNILIRVIKNEKSSFIKLNETLITYVEPSALKGGMNPGAYDFKEAMKRKNIYHQLTLKEGQFIKVRSEKNTLKTKALMLRANILESLEKKEFSQEELSVIKALLLGSRQGLVNETMAKYQKAGAMHLLAISGLHIGILIMMLNFILKPLEKFRHGRKTKLVCLIIALWFFAFLSGLSASVIRAVGMFSILTIGVHMARSKRLDHYLFAALFISLIINPRYVFDLGFQLSYAAVMSIFCFSPVIRSFWNPNHKLIRYFWNLIVISLSAQLGVLPLSLYYFHQFSTLFFISSLCIIPFLGIILGVGYFMIILIYFDILPDVYTNIYGWMIRTMNQTIEKLSGIHQLIFENVFFTLLLLGLGYLLVFFLFFWMQNQRSKYLKGALLCAISIFVSLLAEKKATHTGDAFIVFHQYNKSLMLHRKGGKGLVFDDEKTDNILRKRLLKEYQLEHYDLDLEESKQMRHFFKIGDKRIMVLDDHIIKTDFGFDPDILILTNSPRINLERLLSDVHPTTIVADGSNFYSFKLLWERTAKKFDIIFYDTAKNGAFTLQSSI